MTSHFYLSLEVFAQTLRQARGTTVGGINETDGSLPSKRLEGMSERSAGGFEGKAFAPVGAGERPCDLPVGPAVRKVEPTRPMNTPVARSSSAHIPKPRRCQWPASIAICRQASSLLRTPRSPTYRMTSGSAHMAAYG